ncbi:lipoprotein [Catellatospora sp. IY07-71]|uniref:fasciclin domain-containing protein n=1 Tax=Catellatospora sp. IY07-71 TaxID=2728827 RepID=UPI001BB7CAB4|nr:fasciclin domain-containing protein [Catellatospora sp. IY07-71]BCJ73522.1 lipoprotein [Catellatospora sp. IY07-71]
MYGKRKLTTVFAVAAFSLSLALAACGSETMTTPAAQPTGVPTSVPTTVPTTMPTGTASPADGLIGAGCGTLPQDPANPGSPEMMAQQPIATAAASNPQLATLTAAIQQAGLADQLNSAEAVTVFAPVNEAFAKIPKEQLDQVLANPEQLKKILTYHVVGQKIDPAKLAATFQTLEGQDITVTGSGQAFKVNDTATIVCGNIPTKNGTVYLIDGVLMPPS